MAGSGFVVLASTLTAMKVIPVEGLALLLGVDRFMSEARSITNFIGNGVATIFLAHTEDALEPRKGRRSARPAAAAAALSARLHQPASTWARWPRKRRNSP